MFWMVATSLIGMATRLVESALSVKYRSRNDLGETVGGPMYTCVRGLKKGQFGKILGISFAVFTVMASFGMGNMVQANAVADSFHAAFGLDKACVGVVISVLTIFCVLGGIESIGKLTRLLVPFMGILYLAGTICVILVHWKNVPETLAGIVLAAFCPRAVSGGLFGSVTVSFFSALRWGVSRGIFSNEAGLGAAGITAAAADTEDYVRQGYISMTGVFLDTVVMCSLTGLAFASSGVLSDASQQESAAADGAVLVLKMFRSTFGVKADGFVSVCIALFAFATIAGWAYQGEKAFEFLAKGRTKYNISYRFVYSLMSFLGCILSLDTVWLISDICNGLMAVPNLICVLLMSGEICRDIQRWKPDTPL